MNAGGSTVRRILALFSQGTTKGQTGAEAQTREVYGRSRQYRMRQVAACGRENPSQESAEIFSHPMGIVNRKGEESALFQYKANIRRVRKPLKRTTTGQHTMEFHSQQERRLIYKVYETSEIAPDAGTHH